MEISSVAVSVSTAITVVAVIIAATIIPASELGLPRWIRHLFVILTAVSGYGYALPAFFNFIFFEFSCVGWSHISCSAEVSDATHFVQLCHLNLNELVGCIFYLEAFVV